MAMARPAKDTRRGIRVRHDSVMELLDADGRLLAGVLTLSDVSSVGASFTTTRTFAKGDAVRGRIRLLRTGVLEIVGRVVRVKEKSNSTLYAVEFESVRGLKR